MVQSKTTLQQHQQALAGMLRELDRVCRKHGIAYQLFAGTALGAVRHKGFIPWDDDLDVVMLREDYDRFLALAPAELDGEKFFLQQEFSRHWPMFFSMLRLNNTACLEKYHPKDPEEHEGVYVDIFPCDNACNSPLGRKLQFLASKVVIAKSLDKRGYDTDSGKKKLFMALCRLLPRAPFLALTQNRKGRDSQWVHVFLGASSKLEKSVFPRRWIAECVEADFEGGRYPVSAHYDDLLTVLYGDYRTLPPESERTCKVHAILVDLEHSWKDYAGYRDNMTFTEYTRSIR